MSSEKNSTDLPGQPVAESVPTSRPSRLTMIMEVFGVSRAITIAALLFALLVVAGAVFLFVQ